MDPATWPHLGSHPHSVDARTDDKPHKTGLRIASAKPSSSTCPPAAPRWLPVQAGDITVRDLNAASVIPSFTHASSLSPEAASGSAQ